MQGLPADGSGKWYVFRSLGYMELSWTVVTLHRMKQLRGEDAKTRVGNADFAVSVTHPGTRHMI